MTPPNTPLNLFSNEPLPPEWAAYYQWQRQETEATKQKKKAREDESKRRADRFDRITKGLSQRLIQPARLCLAEHFKFWFNRVDAVIGWTLFLPTLALYPIMWSIISDADWYYRLLWTIMMVGALERILALVLSPLALIFWLIDSRYPIGTRFLKGCWSLL